MGLSYMSLLLIEFHRQSTLSHFTFEEKSMGQFFSLSGFIICLGLFSCGGQAEKKVVVLERPGDTEFTQTRHVKNRNGRENKKRVEYYNSLQYKNAYKQL